jgi:glyceraldehyde 3-phosphate dehydrogenase
VNEEILKPSDIIVSAGSCTTNSLASMVQLLDNKFGLKAGFMTTIHAYTGTQMLLDGPRGKNGRVNRAAAINTIEHSTGAAKAIGKVVPSVDGKVQGHAQRVAVPDGSVTELTSILSKKVTIDEINDAFKAEFADKDYFGYNADGIVTSDIIGDTHGGVFDPTQTDVNQVGDDQLVRTVSFYDNENGFTCNMIRTLLYFAQISEK